MQSEPKASDPQAEYRKLPQLDALLRTPEIAGLAADHGRAPALAALRSLLDEARAAIQAGEAAPDAAGWPAALAARLAEASRPSLQPLINATGVIIHTNLGRAPLSAAARQAVDAVAAGYSTLEYDLDTGRRGSRHDHARRLLCRLTGAEDALVVNNNAAAVFLALTGLCQGRDVIISRGQLVEIGGGFRIPDVLRQSGARLVEVGATNRTHLSDFAAALSPATAAIMRVHSSNFRQIGFVSTPDLPALAELAHSRPAQEGGPILLIDDLGSGTLLDLTVYGLAAEPMVQQSVAAGADIVTFSGDKLLGGPQAGIIAGRAVHVERLRRHPLARALRVDKLTLAALEATLRSYDRQTAAADIPVWRMIAAAPAALYERATRWQQTVAAAGLAATVRPVESAVGGGSLPGETLPSFALALEPANPAQAAARLRRAGPPVICRVQHDLLLFDARTVLPEQDDALLAALLAALPEALAP